MQQRSATAGEGDAQRSWTELRIRNADLVKDVVTLPIQRVREEVSELIKASDDKDTGQELIECNRRLVELREELAMFLSQRAEDHVYWVERSGKAQKNLSLERRADRCRRISCAAGFSAATRPSS